MLAAERYSFSPPFPDAARPVERVQSRQRAPGIGARDEIVAAASVQAGNARAGAVLSETIEMFQRTIAARPWQFR
ncbi:hypothetical protein [Nocardia pseudovaccinii]|uniref:hypothetical protein n=1 Tax=Nocardia pseudovaccinii TaxID=189540 RepID=UPI0007A453C2|nr:hypothetical protein [Nocardia pseudovaccinii]